MRSHWCPVGCGKCVVLKSRKINKYMENCVFSCGVCDGEFSTVDLLDADCYRGNLTHRLKYLRRE